MDTWHTWKKKLLTKFWAESSEDNDVVEKTMLKKVYGRLWNEFD